MDQTCNSIVFIRIQKGFAKKLKLGNLYWKIGSFLLELRKIEFINTHKMGKNFSNELKFRPDMYFYGFYQIPGEF